MVSSLFQKSVAFSAISEARALGLGEDLAKLLTRLKIQRCEWLKIILS